jgi:hypothetical protein
VHKDLLAVGATHRARSHLPVCGFLLEEIVTVVRGEYTRKKPCIFCRRKTTTRSPRYYKTGRHYWVAICLGCFSEGKQFKIRKREKHVPGTHRR